MSITEIIAAKRDGRPNSSEELRHLVLGYVRGIIPDYQVSAWLMAAYLRGLSEEETFTLTEIMASSGDSLDLSSLPSPRVDKHSTGGVGDKTSLVVVPLLASCGCSVVKMSGRGLGITGGTVDKLESIPGFRTALSPEEMMRVAEQCGCCLAGQTERLAPADRLVYSLRDATATVGSIPLITSSIMSKKLAVGAEALVLDVKCGRGAFMRHIGEAKALARSLIKVGTAAGRRIAVCITDMEAPLGMAVGNALEVIEAVETLRNGGPRRFRELCLELSAEALVLCGLAPDRNQGRDLAGRRLADGSALERFRHMVKLQGGDTACCDDPEILLSDITGTCILSECSGYVVCIDAGEIGQAVVELGAGRTRKEDAIDHAVGIVMHVELGDPVEVGLPLATIYARSEAACERATERVRRGVLVEPEPIEASAIVLERLV